MGFQTSVFKCQHCGQQMSDALGPNWSVVPGIAVHGSVVVLSCTNGECQAVLGATHVTPKP